MEEQSFGLVVSAIRICTPVMSDRSVFSCVLSMDFIDSGEEFPAEPRQLPKKDTST